MRLAIALLCACGGKAAPAPAPDPGALAGELHGELVELGSGAHGTRADCPRMATALRPIIVRMRATVDRAHAMQADATLGPQLVTAMKRYDGEPAIVEAIVADLATCRDDAEVRALIDAMPTL